MAEFVLQRSPEVSPRLCYTCGTHEGPFLNTMTLDNAGRMILLCAPSETRESGCVGMMANLCGCLTPAAASAVRLERDQAYEELEAVRLRLERIRDGVVEVVG